jgi:hypothetical protein
MSFRSMLSKRGDLYPLKSRTVAGSFGLPGNTEFYYDTTPDRSIPCEYQGLSISRTKEQGGQRTNEYINIFLMLTENVKAGDILKIDGVSYKLETPTKIRRSHIEVKAGRIEAYEQDNISG